MVQRSPTPSALRDAWLLLGPTGSGKSPTGTALARATGRYHLDFGQWLREIAAGHADLGLDDREIAFIGELLESRALFPDAAGSLAEKIVVAILSRHAGGRDLILNGIPRHAGQARSLAAVLTVSRVIVLECPPDVVASRVARRRRGDGDDHAGRDDDAPEDVRAKLRVYQQQTRPLVEWYRQRGTPVETFSVAVATTAEQMVAQIGGAGSDRG